MSQLRITSDGSHTLYVPEIDECYHSTNGAIQESMHIFIRTALQQCSATEIAIFEVGFGTGLNAFLTMLDAQQRGVKIHYTAVELYPILPESANALNYVACCKDTFPCVEADFGQLHQAAWNKKVELTPYFSLTKIQGDLNTLKLGTEKFDVIYFDAFSPEKQPDMWSEHNFRNIYAACKPHAILTTYCAKGVIRRTMQQVGFVVERLAGPPGKREILRAIK